MNKKYFITGMAEIILCVILFIITIILNKPMILTGIVLLWTSGTMLIMNNIPNKISEEEKYRKGVHNTLKYKGTRYGKWNSFTIGKKSYSALSVVLCIQYSVIPVSMLICGGLCSFILVLKMRFEYALLPLLITITITLLLTRIFENRTNNWTCMYCSKNIEDIINWHYGEEKPNEERMKVFINHIVYEDGWYMYF